MGGFSDNTNPSNSRQITPERVQAFMQSDNPLARAASYFMSNTNFGSKLGGLLNGLWGQLGQGGNQQGNSQTMPGGTPQQGSQSAYPGFQMPAYTYHRSMPQFTFDNGTYGGTTAPAAGMNLYGGALNLPGWAMQQAGQTPTAGNWRPDITDGNGGGGRSGGNSNDWSPYRQLMAQGYAYVPGQGMATMDPRMWSGPVIGNHDGNTYDLRNDSDWQKIFGSA